MINLENFVHESWLNIFKGSEIERQITRILGDLSSTYPENHFDGYAFRKPDSITERHLNQVVCFPRFPEIFAPFCERIISPADVSVLIVWGTPEPYISTGIPWKYNNIVSPPDGIRIFPYMDSSVPIIESLLKRFSHNSHKDISNLYENKTPTILNVDSWMRQGVLPIYALWTSDSSLTGDHVEIWADFVQYIIRAIVNYTDPVIVLMGSIAQIYSVAFADSIQCPCPKSDPPTLFRDSDVFNEINNRLSTNGLTQIAW